MQLISNVDVCLGIALGRLLLAEHRDTDASKEFGELLEVLERWRGDAAPESSE